MENQNIFAATTPKISKQEVAEIDAIEDVHLGGGVVHFKNAVDVKREIMAPWIDSNAQSAHEQRWKYQKDLDGQTYAINEDGNKFSLEQVEEVPVRVLQPVTESTEPHIVDIFRNWEDQIYKCLIKYIHRFPFAVGTIWWRSRGHVLRYDEGDYLGVHNDNDSNYRATGGERFIPRGQVQMRQVIAAMLYINDCVDSDEKLDGTNYTGGELFFPYLNISHQAKAGDILLFPTNYMATHGVNTVRSGKRYGYLEFFSQGISHPEVLINVAEPADCDNWCRPHWIDSVYDDFALYSKHAEFGKENFGIMQTNPVYQNRALEGDNGLIKPYYASKVKEDTLNRGKEYPEELL